MADCSCKLLNATYRNQKALFRIVGIIRREIVDLRKVEG